MDARQWVYNGRSAALEDKEYTKENAKPEDIQAIRDCVYLLEPGIIYWYETHWVTEFTIGLISERIGECARGMPKTVLLVDLTRVHRPDAKTRALLKEMLSHHSIAYMAAFTGKNSLLTMAAKFVLSSVFGRNFTVLKDREAAIEAARKAFE